MKNIVFVNPPFELKDRCGPLAQAGSTEPPFGLCYLAAAARKAGYNAAIIDAEAEKLSLEAALERTLSIKPDYIGVTAVTSSIDTAGEFSRRVRQSLPGAKIIIGGSHFTSLPQETLREFPAFDAGVIGEGEETLVDLLNAFLESRDLGQVAGIVFRNQGKIIMTVPRPRIKDIDSLAPPAFDLLPDLTQYYYIPAQSVERTPAISLVTSRGCTGKCVFCDRSVFGNVCRAHGADYVMGVIKDLYHRYGIRNIMFENDNFLIFKDRVIELLNRLKEEKLDLTWSCASRVDSVDENILKLMKEAGCWQILYGIESGSQNILNSMKKGITLKQSLDALKLTKRSGINTKGFILLGSPSESDTTLRQTLNFCLKSGLDDISITFFNPYPGTEAFTSMSDHGFLINNRKIMSQFEVVFVPNGLTKHKLNAWARKIYRAFYFRPGVMLAYLKRIKSLKVMKGLFSSAFTLLRYVLFGNSGPISSI